jgi:hypothetical protein
VTVSTALVVTSTALATAIIASLEYRARSNIVTAGFWFDDGLTFAMAAPEQFGGPLTDAERKRIEHIAREEVAHAFREFRIRVTDTRDAFYRVGVDQMLTAVGVKTTGRWSGAAGQSNVFGPLGGAGAVSFFMIASQAAAFAPEGATRADLVDAIGRGIGRAAVHEFAHQILPRGPMHITTDERSYEFVSSNRSAQYFGEMHWSVAHEALLDRLGK